MEFVITILVFIAVSGLAGVLLLVWIILNIAQLIRRTLSGRPRPAFDVDRDLSACAAPNCRAINPPAARYCRRCGHPMDELPPLPRRSHRPHLGLHQGQLLREM